MQSTTQMAPITIRCGDPNGSDLNRNPLPEWKEFSCGRPERMVFADVPRMEPHPQKPITEFLLDQFFRNNNY